MKKDNLFINILILFLFNSCGQRKTDSDPIFSADSLIVAKTVDTTANNNNQDSTRVLTPSHFTPMSFIRVVTSSNHPTFPFNIITMTNAFPENWVKKRDIDSLIILTPSTVKCACFMSPLSSFTSSDSAEIGGYAIIFINSYRHNTKVDLGLNACPKTNVKSVAEIKKWWTKQQRTTD